MKVKRGNIKINLGMNEWNGFIWLRIGSNDRILLIR